MKPEPIRSMQINGGIGLIFKVTQLNPTTGNRLTRTIVLRLSRFETKSATGAD